MPWFRLDEGFHSHPKVITAGNEATGLYVRCGTYAAQHLTNGFVPEHIVGLYGGSQIRSRGDAADGKAESLADTLVRVKLWRRVRGGWRMPDYLDYNPSKQAVDKERKQAAERQRRRRAAIASRRESTRESHPPDPSRSVTDPVVDVINRTDRSNGARAGPDVIQAIITEILERTGRHVTDEWAQRIADGILGGRHVASPAAYCRQAIRADPDPRHRFLPLY